ncbi:MAG: hypothetical protein ABS949_16310 [Solibacillus sp.]
MKLGNLVKAAVKYGPIIYPIVKKIIDSKSASKPTTTRPTRRTK